MTLLLDRTLLILTHSALLLLVAGRQPSVARPSFLKAISRNLNFEGNTFPDVDCGPTDPTQILHSNDFPCPGLEGRGGRPEPWTRAEVAHPRRTSFVVKLVCMARDGGLWLCGGTIIGEDLVITAAHCVADKVSCKIEAGRVRESPEGGREYLNQTGWAWGFCVLPDYKPMEGRGPESDVALIQLTQKLTFNDYVQRACINPFKYHLDDANGNCWAVGFNSPDLANASTRFLWSRVRRDCGNLKPPEVHEEGRSCYRLERDGSTCPGDSGMGLFCVDVCPGRKPRNFIVGVNSFGQRISSKECDSTTRYNIYSDFYKLRTELDIMLRFCREFH